MTFLRGLLALGPVAAREIDRRALDASLLEKGQRLGGSKVFRMAVTHQ
jgi:hypothetical protein